MKEIRKRSLDYNHIAHAIIALKNADLELRDRLIKEGNLGEGYNVEMEQLHIEHATVLDRIIDSIGYPTISKVGEEASEAAWLVIQHAIGQPDFMKKCACLLEDAVSKEDASPRDLAYLTDRISVYEGKPQLYGTQFDWDGYGVLSPQPYDDLIKVNQRRASIGLNSVKEQTAIIRRRAKQENESPPVDFKNRKRAFDNWRRQVGWIS